MVLEQVVEKFHKYPKYLQNGAGKLSKLWNTDKNTIYKAKEIVRSNLTPELPNVLLLDIETAPLRGYIWSRWNNNIYPDQMISDWFMLSWSAKWLFKKDVYSDVLTTKEVKNEDDKRITESIWVLVNQADIIITHNGDKFDLPKLNSRFLVNNLNPASSFQSIDTKKVASKQFGFSSNKLSELAKVFGFPNKLDTDFELWSKCMDGDIQSLKYMEKYNKQDVILLEDIYLKLRPWIKAHPNLGLYIESSEPVCANCGSEKLKEDHFYYTSTGRYKTYRCECGAINRVRQTDYPKDKRKKLLISVGK